MPNTRLSTAEVLTREQQRFLREATVEPVAHVGTTQTNTSAVRGQAKQSLTVCLSPRIVHALRRAASERSLDYVEPYTQQAIAEAGLTFWLRREGYLDD